MKAFFAVLLVALASFQLANAQCTGNGVEINGACACYSGFAEIDCSLEVSGSCYLPTVAPLSTQVVAEFMTDLSSVANDVFTFEVHSPAANQRYFSSISLNGNVNCSYPSDYYFIKNFTESGCKDTFTGTFQIPEVVDNCGFTQSSEPGFAVLSGKVQVSAVDQVGTFRGHTITRTTSSSLLVNLRLPTFINVTTSDLTVFSPINIMAAVTGQEYESGTVTVQVTTSVQWPYQLTDASAGTLANQLFSATASAPSTTDCTTDLDSDCLQVTELVISISDICSFDGIYSIDFTTGCRPVQGLSCPIPGTDASAISFSLTGEDVCGEVEIEATIDGELASYDAALSTETLVVLAGNPLYFLVSLTSDVTIESISIQALRVVQNGVPVTIVENGAAISPDFDGIGFNPNYGGLGGAQLAFSFSATTDLFSASEGVFPFTVEGDFEVSYKTTFGRKRDAAKTSLSFVAQAVLNALH